MFWKVKRKVCDLKMKVNTTSHPYKFICLYTILSTYCWTEEERADSRAIHSPKNKDLSITMTPKSNTVMPRQLQNHFRQINKKFIKIKIRDWYGRGSACAAPSATNNDVGSSTREDLRLAPLLHVQWRLPS